MKNEYRQLKPYLLLWSTQALSALGSGMTNYALILWLYLQSGSALKTALLSICTYAPYVLMSIFAGALSDRWNKKRTMLSCDCIAAAGTVIVFLLIKTENLHAWHLYLLNAINGLMNTVQQPAGEVAATMLTLYFMIHIPENQIAKQPDENVLASARKGLSWLRQNRLILNLILFLACINLIASVYDAALPAMILSKPNGGKMVLGMVNTCVGIATLAGSVLVTILPAPKNRVRAICLALLLSMSTENFMLAFGNSPIIWCIAAVLGWLAIPFMSANMDVIFRSTIPPNMQGRVYACRNTLQFFTIPIGFLLGGVLVDHVCEPLMAKQTAANLLPLLFGIIGVIGVLICLIFTFILKKHNWNH